MNERVTREEVAQILRGIAAGDVNVEVQGETWDETFAGDVAFNLSSGHHIVIFNDCDDFDYVDSVILADGRCGDFDDWKGDVEHLNDSNPCDLITADEQRRCHEIFKRAGQRA